MTAKAMINYLDALSITVAILALAIALFIFFKVLGLQKLRKDFFAGKQATDLEAFIINQNRKINELTSRASDTEAAIGNLGIQQKLSVQKIGLIRYNPFNGDGGNLSFSMAILDAHNNGVIITSMHGREQNRIYAKPIARGKSEITLTTEEKQAITSAKNL